MTIEGIILRVIPVKESSAMITLLSEDKIRSFLVKGAFRKKYNNPLITTPMLLGSFTFLDSKSNVLIFKELIPLIDISKTMNDINKLFAINFINEVTLHFFADDETEKIYSFLKNIIYKINESINTIPFVLIYLAMCLKEAGYGLNVNNCVRSRNKNNIVGVSYIDGGFISETCFKKDKDILYSANKIKIMHYIFNINLDETKFIEFNKNDAREVLKDLLEYSYNQIGFKFKNIQILDKI